MEKSKIYLLWNDDDIIGYFNEDEFNDLIMLVIDLNFEEEYLSFLDILEDGDSVEEALNYSQFACRWFWEEVSYWR